MPSALHAQGGAGPVPLFYLYGEPPGDVERAFLHVETIPRRSSLHDWTIRAHAHPDHHQILILTQGRAAVRLEDDQREVEATSLIVVPALAVHGFRFSPGADGYVLTISASFLDEALDGDGALAAAFSGAGRSMQPEPDPSLLDALQCLEREFVWAAPGRRTAIKLHLQRILLAIARQRSPGPASGTAGLSRNALTVIRYRDLIEREFRQQPGLPALARALGVTGARLNTACRATTGQSALGLVHDRIIVEAKRHLVYTSMTVAEIARSVGFADPAYFNRFFSRRTGTSPGSFRATNRSSDRLVAPLTAGSS